MLFTVLIAVFPTTTVFLLNATPTTFFLKTATMTIIPTPVAGATDFSWWSVDDARFHRNCDTDGIDGDFGALAKVELINLAVIGLQLINVVHCV